ncbi:MAG: MBOAT family protein [Bacteroidia bacterium]|nr:MBOAT family protein [Bacteroidia bacterium]
MDFHKAIFLTVFLPVFLFIYGVAARQYKNSLLLAASLIFYAWFEPVFVFVLLGTTALDFVLVRFIAAEQGRKRKLYLALSLCVNLSLLVWYKYRLWIASVFGYHASASDESLIIAAIPLGISFYTFESITYLVDVYRGQQQPLKKFQDYLLYILMFPKLLGGPIVRYGEISTQLEDRSANENLQNWLGGFYRFAIGLGKKVLIADQLSRYYVSHTMYGVDPEILSAGDAWLGLFAGLLMVYFDFSGYTDIALGIGKMLGFRLPENFNNPLLSTGISDFWKRWHMTLTGWMRNYLYIPLGGNAGSKMRTAFNVLLLFIISGIWHGAGLNFLLWGLFHGMMFLAEKAISFKLPKVFATFLTVLIITYSMSFFFMHGSERIADYHSALFGLNDSTGEHTPRTEFWLPFFSAVFFAFFACTTFTRNIQDRLFQTELRTRGHIVYTLISIVLFVLALSYSTSIEYRTFVYFRF